VTLTDQQLVPLLFLQENWLIALTEEPIKVTLRSRGNQEWLGTL